RAGDLEGELGGVHLVVGAVGEGDPHVHDRVAGQDAELRRLLAAGVHGRDVLPRDAATVDLVLELVAAAVAAGRLQVDEDLGVLPGPAGLLAVGVLDLLRLAADRLPVGDLRAADAGLHPD